MAPVIKVIEVVKQREQTLDDIRLVCQRSPDNEANFAELEGLLILLRTLSIRTVELIVLWRDQFRYLSLLSTK